ncbi:MAG: PPC domain-containing protein, partial [Gammaproteobacteria bacterium]|nr:PPC domain-containing protein [Gammaproteobacteria bacterium]
MRVDEVSRDAARKLSAQRSGNLLALLPVGETEPVGTRGVNDMQATAQFIAGFGTGGGDDGAVDISGNLKIPAAATAFTPLAEDEGDINKASPTSAGDDQARTAMGYIGDGPFGSPILTEVPIGPFAEDDGDIPQSNVTNLALGQVVIADGEIGDGPFASGTVTESGDFDVYSFSVTAPQSVVIEVNHRDGDTSLDPIVALVDSNGDVLFVNDDNGFSVESSLYIDFTCPSEPCSTETFYAFVGGYSGEFDLTEASFPSDRFDSSTGPGFGAEGLYEIRISKLVVNSGDFDFYAVSANANDLITVEVDTFNFGGELDPIVALYDSSGNVLAFNDDDPDPSEGSFDSFLSFFAPQNDTYYVAVGGFDPTVFPDPQILAFLTDPFDSSSGPGSGLSSEGNYDIIVSRNNIDLDYFAFDLDAGDIIGVNITGAAPQLAFYAENQQLLVATPFPNAGIFPPSSPLPGGGNANAAYVVGESGRYAVAVGFGEGAYGIEVRAFRPAQEATGTTQRIFIDFNGASVDTSKFGGTGVSQPASLSSLASFLPAWGLSGGDENAVIDAILATVEQNLSTDIRLTGNNPAFDIEILNSRDDADSFGDPDVSRVIVGGTIAEAGISTIGIAESIDVGNFALAEDALVLLDLLSAPAGDPNSLNSITLGSATKIQL